MVTRTVKMSELFSLQPVLNLDYLGIADGSCHMTYNPDDVTILTLKFDAASTTLLKQKYQAIKALLDETITLTATIEKRLEKKDVPTTIKDWVDTTP